MVLHVALSRARNTFVGMGPERHALRVDEAGVHVLAVAERLLLLQGRL